MPLTLAEKIIAKASGRDSVTPGEIVTCHVDLAMMHDSAGPRSAGKYLDELGVPVWDLDKLVVITDHYINSEMRSSTRSRRTRKAGSKITTSKISSRNKVSATSCCRKAGT